MHSLVNILKNMLPKTIPKQVGRWNNDYCHK